MTNEGSSWVEWSLRRLVAELVRCDYAAKVIEKATRKAQLTAWLDVKEVRRAARWNKEEADAFARLYDEVRRVQREADNETVRREGEEATSRRRERMRMRTKEMRE